MRTPSPAAPVESMRGRGGDSWHKAPLFLAVGWFGPIQLICIVMLFAAIRRAYRLTIDG